jgi:hypothetical protein
VTARINHVKAITPEPDVVDAFLREVCEVPDGWPIGADAAPLDAGAPLGPGGDLADDVVASRRRATAERGFITGTPDSRQVQIFTGEPAAFWAICISTRHVEDVYERARARGVPCTPIQVADWNERDNIRYFFCEVGGLMFEVMRVEAKT